MCIKNKSIKSCSISISATLTTSVSNRASSGFSLVLYSLKLVYHFHLTKYTNTFRKGRHLILRDDIHKTFSKIWRGLINEVINNRDAFSFNQRQNWSNVVCELLNRFLPLKNVDLNIFHHFLTLWPFFSNLLHYRTKHLKSFNLWAEDLHLNIMNRRVVQLISELYIIKEFALLCACNNYTFNANCKNKIVIHVLHFLTVQQDISGKLKDIVYGFRDFLFKRQKDLVYMVRYRINVA